MRFIDPNYSLLSSLKANLIPAYLLYFAVFLPTMCKSQSNCAFMNEIDGLNLTGMPTEPAKDIHFKHCPTVAASCCTTEIENELKQKVEAEVVESVRDQIAILKQFFHNYGKIFKEQFKSAISVSQRNLDILFRRTYGPFYISNSRIFEDFFASLATQLGSHNPKEIKSSLGNLFQQIYIKEFSLMNPLRILTEKELACMEELQESLRPFGSVPKKIGLLLGRAFNAWTAILQSMNDTEELLDDIKDSSWTLTEHCVSELTRMRYCQICAGRSAYLKPCPNYCMDTLWSCLSGFSAIDASFNRFLDSLIQFSGRLKNVHNPYNSLAPTPVQISESIMLFQEKGSLFSSRILLRCFQSDLRVKRSSIVATHKSSSEENLLAPPFDILAKGLVEKADAFRFIVVGFADKVTRIRGFWRLLAQTLCLDKGLATTTGEMCWTGTSDGPYLRRYTKVQKRQRSPDTSRSGNELEST
ncbi:glypican domain-containing protein [Ditylenchus destructor]|uniref:Glypican domain-containing protein n=1 Tax=Ditylenchus destructor TaxID=166010 RepID=A0AAD4N9C7_9BILA|nr:glypican domain-containing protein [Ditylenchus destructor]